MGQWQLQLHLAVGISIPGKMIKIVYWISSRCLLWCLPIQTSIGWSMFVFLAQNQVKLSSMSKPRRIKQDNIEIIGELLEHQDHLIRQNCQEMCQDQKQAGLLWHPKVRRIWVWSCSRPYAKACGWSNGDWCASLPTLFDLLNRQRSHQVT